LLGEHQAEQLRKSHSFIPPPGAAENVVAIIPLIALQSFQLFFAEFIWIKLCQISYALGGEITSVLKSAALIALQSFQLFFDGFIWIKLCQISYPLGGLRVCSNQRLSMSMSIGGRREDIKCHPRKGDKRRLRGATGFQEQKDQKGGMGQTEYCPI
jgi:hypothetical protein